MPLAAPSRARMRSDMVQTSRFGIAAGGDPDNEHRSRYESRAAVSSAGTRIRIILEGERGAPTIRRAADALRLLPRYVPCMPRKPPLADTLLAAVLAAVKLVMVATSWQIDGGSRPLTYVAALLLTVPLAWRRVAPLLSASIVFGARRRRDRCDPRRVLLRRGTL